TRKYAGLPPTPICNPSISSIQAAADPALTNYWYYLHDPSGEVHYASTLDEHNANKAKYIN
ncbi:endolytic transglycosylase MltG, partial [Patescibacteria group bacterium]|nr:endolytic transglycosylase MltG [Patescibacteria group bacterium]